MLRLRRNILGEVRGALRRDGPVEDRFHRAHRRRYRGFARSELPDADPGSPFARGFADSPHASPRSAGQPINMSVQFDRKIHKTLADANLQLAILTATGRLKQHRIDNVAEDVLPGYQEMRTHANA